MSNRGAATGMIEVQILNIWSRSHRTPNSLSLAHGRAIYSPFLPLSLIHYTDSWLTPHDPPFSSPCINSAQDVLLYKFNISRPRSTTPPLKFAISSPSDCHLLFDKCKLNVLLRLAIGIAAESSSHIVPLTAPSPHLLATCQPTSA